MPDYSGFTAGASTPMGDGRRRCDQDHVLWNVSYLHYGSLRYFMRSIQFLEAVKPFIQKEKESAYSAYY